MGIPANHPSIARALTAGLIGSPRFASESQFQAAVDAVLSANGWLHYHTHNSRRSRPGFPDTTAVRGTRLVFIELKMEDGVLSTEQHAWRTALGAAGGNVEYYLFRPSDWRELVEVLR